MTTRQLLIWPEGAGLAPVKTAFESLNAPFKASPHWFQLGVHEGRVLVLADGFNFIHDHIYPKSESLLPMAIEWVLGLRELDRGPRLVNDILSKAIGGEVIERTIDIEEDQEDG